MSSGPPSIGDWVQASDSLEFDLKRHGAVGTLQHIIQGEKRLYIVGEGEEGRAFGSYLHVRRITKAEGRDVIKAWRELWYGECRSKSMGDQIREFLAGEARKANQ